jgi:Ni/Co efflux regulator RcnB
MRIAIIAAMAALSFGCIGISGASSAPASGTAIEDSAAASNPMQKVEDRDHSRDRDRDHSRDRDRDHSRDRDRDHRHCHWRHWHRVCD